MDWRRQPFNIMNKVLLIITLVSACSLNSRGQGLIKFTASVEKISVNSQVGGPATGLLPANTGTTGMTYDFALYASATATTVGGTQTAPIAGYMGNGGALQSTYAFADNNWELVDYGVNTAAGKFIGDEQGTAGATTVPGIPAGSDAQFVVVGWDAALGSTIGQLESSLLDPAETGWIGQSAVSGPIELEDGITVPITALFGNGAPFLQGFVLGEYAVPHPDADPTPEPASLAMGVMGGLAVLAFRRKQG